MPPGFSGKNASRPKTKRRGFCSVKRPVGNIRFPLGWRPSRAFRQRQGIGCGCPHGHRAKAKYQEVSCSILLARPADQLINFKNRIPSISARIRKSPNVFMTGPYKPRNYGPCLPMSHRLVFEPASLMRSAKRCWRHGNSGNRRSTQAPENQ